MYVFRNSCSSFFSPLGEVDEEARLAIPERGVPAAVFLDVLGSTWGLLGSFFGVLGKLLMYVLQ